MIDIPTQTTKLETARESFFRPAAMEKLSPPPLDIALLARPLSFRLISLTLATMIIISSVYLSNVDYASTQTIQGNTVYAHDESIHFVVIVSSATALSLQRGDRATVQLNALPSDPLGAIGATIISVDSIHEDVPGSQGVRISLQLDQEFLEAPGRRIPLQAGLSGHTRLLVETKSLLAWIIHYFPLRQ